MGADETQERPFVIEEWKEETLTDAVAIWNQVVEDGAAFPQTELLDRRAAENFSHSSPLQALQGRKRPALSWDSISCTPTM